MTSEQKLPASLASFREIVNKYHVLRGILAFIIVFVLPLETDTGQSAIFSAMVQSSQETSFSLLSSLFQMN